MADGTNDEPAAPPHNKNPTDDFEGQVALVTGAGSGPHPATGAHEPADNFDRIDGLVGLPGV
jgi:hypothetical protein